jgi:hypothetical protein
MAGFGWFGCKRLEAAGLLMLAGRTDQRQFFWRQSPLHIQIQFFVPMQHIT